jgi:hypothetical protein
MGRRTSTASPSIVVAGLALVAALAGTALAGEATTSAKPVTKKQVQKIATKQINELAPGLSVANANTANSATNAQNAVDAQNALNAQNAADSAALGGTAAGNFAVPIIADWNTGGGAQVDEAFGTFGNLILTGRCIDQGANPRMEIQVQKTGAGSGEAQIAYTQTGGDASDSTSQNVSSSQLTLFVENEDGAEGAGVLIYNDSVQVTVVPYRLFTEVSGGDAFCEFAGQATTTSP